MPSTHVALLRGINLAGKNRLPMKELIEMFENGGCGGAAAYIQSGNVIFTAAPAVASRIAALITTQIKKRFGFDVPVILRTADELKKVISNNPFLKAGVAEKELHVMFLADAPDASHIRTLDPDRSPPDTYQVRGREIYLRLPNGMGRSKLSNQYFDSKLATVSTARNWRTVTTLLELMKA
jgi:uncharacterized protein (DUF1697 family)